MSLIEYNYLSGAIVNNNQNMYMDTWARVIENGSNGDDRLYMGYAHGKYTWGKLALIQISLNPASGNEWKNNYIGSATVSSGFFDENTGTAYSNNGAESYRRQIFLYYTENDQPLSNSNGNNIEDASIGGDGYLYLAYMNEDWMLVDNLNPFYYEFINTDPAFENRTYYVVPYNKDFTKAVTINKKQIIEQPFNRFKCNLFFTDINDIESLFSNNYLTYTVNVNGEVLIEGMQQNDIDLAIAYNTVNPFNTQTSWTIKDVRNNIIHSNLKFDDPDNLSNEIVLFEDAENQQKYMKFTEADRINHRTNIYKILIGGDVFDEYAIWHESLPYDTTPEGQVRNGNPPGLAITYLKNNLLHNSLFDIKGLVRIEPSEISFSKEIRTVAEENMFLNLQTLGLVTVNTYEFKTDSVSHHGYLSADVSANSTVIPLMNDHNFVIGDTITVSGVGGDVLHEVVGVDYAIGDSFINITPELTRSLSVSAEPNIVSETTAIASRIKFATTKDIKVARKYDMYQVLLQKTVPGGRSVSALNSPTMAMYRQMFICYNPKYYDSTLGVEEFKKCTLPLYGETELFNTKKHEYDMGYIFYLANKIPLEREFIDEENFEILLF